MTPRARRGWGIGILVFFVVMCAMIAWSQWYAVNVNVPFYQSQHAPAKKP
jgi:DNA-binding transcriptional regulator of glucitol operon